MRLTLAAVVMLVLPALAGAQSAAPAPGSVPMLPPLGLPLPRIGLPHPPTGLPVPAAPKRHGSADRRTSRQGRPHQQIPYFVPVYGWPYLYEVPVASSSWTPPQASTVRQPQPQPATGRLQFDVAAGGDQQLFIDGFYQGTLGEFAGGVDLEPGPHGVEISGPEFETVRFSVNIAVNRTITYRPTLKAAAAGAASVPAAASPPPFVPPTPMVGYIVPGCYIGNVPPQDAGLPATCDLSRTITIKR